MNFFTEHLTFTFAMWGKVRVQRCIGLHEGIVAEVNPGPLQRFSSASAPHDFAASPSQASFPCFVARSHMQVDADHLGNNIVNLHMHPELALGSMLPRGPERVSLTVRRVEKVVKSLLRLKNS